MTERKLTPFEDKLSEIIVSNQGLLTFDACVNAAVENAPSLLWFAEKELEEEKTKSSSAIDVVSFENSKLENKNRWRFENAVRTLMEKVQQGMLNPDSSKDVSEVSERLFEIANEVVAKERGKELLHVCEKSYNNGKRDTEFNIPKWKKTEPEPGLRYVLLFATTGSVFEADEYRPNEMNFYYQDGEQYECVKYNSPWLVGWMYSDELKQLQKEDGKFE